MCRILLTIAKGNANRQLQTKTIIIIIRNESERFCHIETGNSKKPYNKNHRVTKIQQLQQELRTVKKHQARDH